MTCFQTLRYCGAKVEFNSVNLVQHGSSTTIETGLRHLQHATPVQSLGSRALQEYVSGCVCVDCDLRFCITAGTEDLQFFSPGLGFVNL